MEKREYFNFPLSNNILIPSSTVFENIAVNLVTGITNMYGDSYFSLNGLWYFISNFEDGIARVASDFLTKFSS